MGVQIISGPRKCSSSKLFISEKEAQLAVRYLKTMANNMNRATKYSKTDVAGHRIKTDVHRRISKQHISPNELRKILKTVMLKKNVYRTKLKKISYRTEKSKSVYFFFDSNSDISNLLTSYHSSYSMFKNYTANDEIEGQVQIQRLYKVNGEEVQKMFGSSYYETTFDEKQKTYNDRELHRSLKTYQFTSTPLIKPFLSDRQITQLQSIQEECRVESEKKQKSADGAVDTDRNKQLFPDEGLGEQDEKTKEEKESVSTKKGKAEKDPFAEEKDTWPLRSKAGSAKQKKQGLSEISPKRTKTGVKSKITQSTVSKPSKLPKQKAVPILATQEKGKSKKALDGDQRDAISPKQSARSAKSETIAKTKSKLSHHSKESSRERKSLKEDGKSLSESSSKKLKSGKSSKLTLGSKKSKESQKAQSKISSKQDLASDTAGKEKVEKEKLVKGKLQTTFSESDSEYQGIVNSSKPGTPDSRKKKQVSTKQRDTHDLISHGKVTTATTANSRKTVTFRQRETDEKGRHKSLIKELLKKMSGIYYQLSDHKFIILGWTLQPKDADMSRIITFKTVAAHPHTYCFRDREVVEKRCYPDGKLGAIFHADGTGKVLYYNGEPAMLFTQSFLGRRVTLWFESIDDLHEKQKGNVIGMFDSYGNGVVYDENGNIRLTYDQAEGVLYDTSINIPYKWQWNSYKIVQEKRMVALLDSILVKDNIAGEKRNSKKTSSSKPVYSQTMMATEEYLQDLAELPYPLPQKIKQSHEQNTVFRPIILKLSKHITLRISAQDNIVLKFNANKLLLCLDLGIIIQPEEKIRVDDMDMGAEGIVPSFFEVLRYPTPSLLAIKKQLQLLRKERGKNVQQPTSFLA